MSSLLLGPGGLRSVVAESVLVKQQLLILNRSRQRSPNLRTSARLVAGLYALRIRLARLIRSVPWLPLTLSIPLILVPLSLYPFNPLILCSFDPAMPLYFPKIDLFAPCR